MQYAGFCATYGVVTLDCPAWRQALRAPPVRYVLEIRLNSQESVPTNIPVAAPSSHRPSPIVSPQIWYTVRYTNMSNDFSLRVAPCLLPATPFLERCTREHHEQQIAFCSGRVPQILKTNYIPAAGISIHSRHSTCSNYAVQGNWTVGQGPKKKMASEKAGSTPGQEVIFCTD